jgi:hypothetical protein
MADKVFVINKPPHAMLTIRVKIGRMFIVRMKLGLFFLGLAASLLNADVQVHGSESDAEKV